MTELFWIGLVVGVVAGGVGVFFTLVYLLNR